mgnify:FL=1
MTRDEKLLMWEKKVEQFDKSGLSMRQWCQENGEVYGTFRHWRKVIQEKNEQEQGQSRWLPLQVLDDTTQHSPIVIKYKEFKIEISQDVDTRLLEDLLRVLKTV